MGIRRSPPRLQWPGPVRRRPLPEARSSPEPAAETIAGGGSRAAQSTAEPLGSSWRAVWVATAAPPASHSWVASQEHVYRLLKGNSTRQILVTVFLMATNRKDKLTISGISKSRREKRRIFTLERQCSFFTVALDMAAELQTRRKAWLPSAP